MKTIVTGGAGFIGSHLVDRLLREGHSVIVIDNLATGTLKHSTPHETDPRFTFVQEDVANHEKILPFFKGVDWVFHLAARADIVPSIEKPLDYSHANVGGTASVLEAARQNNVKKFIYTASYSCYGIPKEIPTKETAAIQTEYPYALTKYLGELSAFHWGKVYRLPVISLRLANVYGPRARTTGSYGAVFGVFLAQKYHGKPFTVVGDGNQTRDFVFVTDVAEAYLAAANSPCRQEIFNVGSGRMVSVNQLVQLIQGEKIHLPKRPGEPDQTLSDITKIKKMLGWEPKVRFEAGVQSLLDHLEDWKEAPLWTKESIEKATQTWFRYLEKTP